MTWLRRIVVVALLCTVSSVLAAPKESAKPWEDKTTKSQRDEAHALFMEGNSHLLAARFGKALELYERAIALFGHPRIRLAAARALSALGRPADAHPQVEAALRWGAAPFDESEYADARALQQTIANQVATLVVHCTTEGARVTLDGQDLLDCPGDITKIVTPGRHQLVGSRDGYLTHTDEVTVIAAQTMSRDVSLRTLEAVAVKKRRWSVWTPWAVIGGGVAIAAIGVPFQLVAASTMDDFRQEVSDACGTNGCAANDPRFTAVEPLESRAKLENRIAISLWVVGGVVAVSGLVMVYANRPRSVIESPVPSVAIIPVVAPDHLGVSLSGRY